MQNLPIPVSAMPLPVNAAPVTRDTAPANGSDSEDFSAVLAREITAEKREPKPDTALAGDATGDDQPQPPGSEVASPQLPFEPSAMVPALLTPMPGMQPGPCASGDQILIQVKTPGASGFRVGNKVGNEENSPLTSRERRHGVPAANCNHEPGVASLPSSPTLLPEGEGSVVLPSPLGRGTEGEGRFMGSGPSAMRLSASSDAWHSREYPMNLTELPAGEPAGAAELAAPGKFLPPVGAEKNTSRIDTDAKLPQHLPESLPLLPLSSLAAAATSPASASAPATQNLQLDIRIGAPGWNGELAQKVVWMVTQQQQVAELRLNPPHLGPVEVTLSLGSDQGNQASIQFASPHLATRDAIESALPRLREMMADNGIALGNVTVGADSFQRQAEAGRHDGAWPKPSVEVDRTGSGIVNRSAVTFIRGGSNGLVDTFA